MAPNPVGIQTSYRQLPGTGFSSDAVNPPLSLKDWSESLIEFTETSGYLLPSAGGSSSSHQHPIEASSLEHGSYLSPYSNLYSSDIHSNTVVTCSVVSGYPNAERGNLKDSKVFSASNRPHDFNIHVSQNNEKASGATSSFDVIQSDQSEADESSHKLNRILTSKELDVTAYVPSRDTRKNMPTSFCTPTTHVMSSLIQISPQASGSRTKERLLQIPLGTESLLSGTQITEQDVSELLPTTLPMNDIDMLSTYDFDIDADIHVPFNASATNPEILQNAPVSGTFPCHDLSEIDTSSNMLSSQTLIRADSRVSSVEDSCRQNDSGFSYVSLDSQCQETDTFTPTCTHQMLTSHPSTKLFSDFEAKKYLPQNPMTTAVPTNTQSVQSVDIHRHKNQLIRSSSDPIFQSNQNIHTSSLSPRFFPKFQHQLSLPADINHPLHEHLHNSPMHLTNYTSFSSSSCNTIVDAYFQEPEITHSSSLYAQQTDSTNTSHSSPYDCLDPNSFIPHIQPQVTSDPVNSDSFPFSLALPEPLLDDTSDITDSLSQLNKSTMESYSDFLPEALNVEKQQAFNLDAHYIPDTIEFKSRLIDIQPKHSASDWSSGEDRGTLLRTENTTTAFSSQLKVTSPNVSRNVSNFFTPSSYFNTIASTTLGFPESRYSCTSIPSRSDKTKTATQSSSCNNLLLSSDNSMLETTSAAVSSVCVTYSSTVTTSRSKNKYSEDVLTTANFPNKSMKTEASKTVENKVAAVSTVLNTCTARPFCPTTTLLTSSSSIPLVKLNPSTEPVNPSIKASLRTKLKGKSMTPSMQGKRYNILDPGISTDVRRQRLKRSAKGFLGADPEKKRARTDMSIEEASTSSTESLDSNQSTSLTMSGLYPSTSHRVSISTCIN